MIDVKDTPSALGYAVGDLSNVRRVRSFLGTWVFFIIVGAQHAVPTEITFRKGVIKRARHAVPLHLPPLDTVLLDVILPNLRHYAYSAPKREPPRDSHMHPMVNVALKAARKAGNIMLQSLERLDTINPTAKGLNDFVTDIDKRAEKEIISILKATYPHHAILSEESGSQRGDAENLWIIDPLDGTHNYLRGFPHFSISIGFKHQGKLQHGLVYDPVRQEVFHASRGEGARLNDRRIRVNPTTRLEQALIGTGFPVRRPNDLAGYLPQFCQLMPKLSNIRCSGSAALDLCYVAAGRLDAFVEMGLGPWDMAAGVLMVKEAGGLVADWQGSENYLESGTIVAATPKVFSSLLPLMMGR